jgi:uncharacterized OsmC-like protein
MSGYQISVKDLGSYSYEITNGRGIVHTAWHPEEGRFLATELFLAGLGACMLATMMYSASVMGMNLTGAAVRVEADSAAKPDRMTNIRVIYTIPPGLSETQKASLIRAGNRCKVHNTIENHPVFDVSVEEFAASAG